MSIFFIIKNVISANCLTLLQVSDNALVALVPKQVTAYNSVNNSTVSRTSASKYGRHLGCNLRNMWPIYVWQCMYVSDCVRIFFLKRDHFHRKVRADWVKWKACLINNWPERQEPERALHEESRLHTTADGGEKWVSLHLTSLLRRGCPTHIAQHAIGSDKVADQRAGAARALSNTHQIEH